MSATRDMWGGPAWAFQSKPDARYDLLGYSSPFGGGGDAHGTFGPWTGNVYYVDNSGSDSNEGTTPDKPFLTIGAALAKVTAGHNDVIVVMDYYGTSRAAESFPITLTSSHNDMTIIGLMRGNAPRNAIYEPTTAATNAIEITTGQYITLINLNLGGTTTASGLTIGDPDGGSAGTALWGIKVVNCSFGISGAGNYGIYQPVESSQDAPQVRIQGCHFGNGVATAGIRMGFNATRGQIVGCDFQVAAGNYGIYIDSTTGMDNICNNVFAIPDDLDGGAIYWENGCTVYNVSGNVATKIGGGAGYNWLYEPWFGPGGTVGLASNIPDPVDKWHKKVAAIWPEYGKLIFVNGGSDGPTDNNRSGFTPHMCKQTINGALALVTAGKCDVVIILNYGSNARAVDFAASPITLAAAHARMRFLGADGNSTKWPTITVNDASANHAFEIQTGADRVEFRNLEIGGAATKAGIHVSVGQFPWGLVFDGCHFGIDTAYGQEGIRVESGGDPPHMAVRNCRFGAALTGSQILIAGNSTRAQIHNNFFKPYTSQVCINVTGGAADIAIYDNIFNVTDAATGDAVTMAAASSGGCIVRNYATDNDGAGQTNNPFKELGTGNGWGLNPQGLGLAASPFVLPA